MSETRRPSLSDGFQIGASRLAELWLLGGIYAGLAIFVLAGTLGAVGVLLAIGAGVIGDSSPALAEVVSVTLDDVARLVVPLAIELVLPAIAVWSAGLFVTVALSSIATRLSSI